MAIADYSTLVAAVKRYAARSDSTFSAAIPDFVGLAEERLYNGHGDPGDPLYSPALRSSVMETSGTITVTDGAGPIPNDYLAMRKVSRSGDTLGLKYLAPERYEVQTQIETAGTPVWYTISGSTLSVVPVWDGDIEVIYWKRHTAITASNATGPLLTAHGLLYLEATLIEAFSFLQAGELAIGHATKLKGLVSGANRSASDLRFSGPLRVYQRVPIG